MIQEEINRIAKRKVARILNELDSNGNLSDNSRQFIKSEIYGFKDDVLSFVNVYVKAKESDLPYGMDKITY